MLKLNRAIASRLAPIAAPLLIALGLTFSFLTFPRQPYNLDDAFSWNAVLQIAHDQGWQFGDDLVFTYGPFGFLLSRYYFPGHDTARLVFDFGFCFLTALAAGLLAWRLGRWHGSLLVAVFALVCANIDPRADLLLFINLFAWPLLSLVDPPNRRPAWLMLFLLTATFASLAKVSFFAPSLLTLASLFIGLLVQGQSRAALGLLLGFPAAVLAAWTITGQHIASFGRFLSGAWAFSKDYDAAMALERIPSLRTRGLLLVLCLIGATLLRTYSRLRQSSAREKYFVAIVGAWLIALGLLAGKYSLTRADLYHEAVLFGFAPLIVLTGPLLGSKQHRVPACGALALTLVSCFIGLFTLQGLFVSRLSAFLLEPLRAIPANATVLLHPGAVRTQHAADLNAFRQSAGLPRTKELAGRSSLDVFGHDQSFVWLNQLNYRPRPVFQSYVAYNRTLTSWNAEWFHATPPPFVLFNLSPIDRRFPPLEDAWTLRELLTNYEPVEQEDRFLLLKATGRREPSITLLKEGRLQPGERLDLEPFGRTNLWLEIEVEPSLIGRIRRFVYKPPPVRLRVWSDERGPGRYNAPAPMLAAGFIASPLLISRDDVQRLYAGAAPKRPRAYSLEVEGQSCWRTPFRYRLYQLDQPLGKTAGEN